MARDWVAPNAYLELLKLRRIVLLSPKFSKNDLRLFDQSVSRWVRKPVVRR